MKELRWHIHCGKGELVACCRYAAIAEGEGATVRFEGRCVLTVTPRTAAVADAMIAKVGTGLVLTA